MQSVFGLLALGFLVILDLDLCVGVGLHREAASFCYEEEECGEKSPFWGDECQSGSRQSPIDFQRPSKSGRRSLIKYGLSADLNFNTVSVDARSEVYRDLVFNDEYEAESFYIVNNGHSIQVQLKSSASSLAQMTGYEMDKPYVFAQAHFHWGYEKSFGSEHTIHGKRFSLELHLVHYSSKYSDLTSAAHADDPKAIAVVAVFLQESPETFCRNENICSRGHNAMRPIIKHLPLNYNAPPGLKVKAKLDLSLFLPESSDAVYRYQGSLTTPNCTEKVLWTVVEQPVFISSADVQAFQKVCDEEGMPLRKNFRSTQKRNNRKIEYFHVN